MAKRVPTKLPIGVIVPYAERPPQLIAGRLSLNFVNTVSYRGVAPHEQGDRLISYAELLQWAECAEAIDPKHARALSMHAVNEPESAARVLRDAVIIREIIAGLVLEPDKTSTSELAYFNTELAKLPPSALMRNGQHGLAWDYTPFKTELKSLLWPMLHDAANLLVSENLPRVRICSSQECSWVFLDLSRTGNRRWCSMKSCGNRHKVNQHYHRTKKAEAGVASA